MKKHRTLRGVVGAALVLAASLFVATPAFAGNGEATFNGQEKSTIEDAINEANQAKSGNIVLLKDAEADAKLDLKWAGSLDLGNFTLSLKGQDAGLEVGDEGNVTITGSDDSDANLKSTGENNKVLAKVNGGSLTLSDGVRVEGVNKKTTTLVEVDKGAFTLDGATLVVPTGDSGNVHAVRAVGAADSPTDVQMKSGVIDATTAAQGKAYAFGVAFATPSADCSSVSPYKFTMTGGTIKGAKTGVFVSSIMNFDMTGGEIIDCVEYGVSGNAAKAGQDVTFTMSGGKIASGGVGIYQTQSGTTTIKGSSSVTGLTGIFVRSGKIDIQGGTVEGTEEYSDPVESPASGITTEGSALCIANGKTTHPDKISVSISGGTLKSAHHSAVSVIKNDRDETESLPIEVLAGATLVSASGQKVFDVYEGQETKTAISVKGGNFSGEVNQKYLGDLGFVVKAPSGEAPYSYYANSSAAASAATACGGSYKEVGKEGDWKSLHAITLSSGIATVEGLPASAFSGDTIEFSVTVPEGFEVLEVMQGETKLEAHEGKYSFTMPEADTTVSVTCGASNVIVDSPVTDVTGGDKVTGIENLVVDIASADLSATAESVSSSYDEATALAALKAANKDSGAEKAYVHVVTTIEVEVKDYDAATNTFVLDITPYFEVLASTVSDSSKVSLETNAVVLQEKTELGTTQPSTITIPVPSEFAAEGDFVRVAHEHGATTTYKTLKVAAGVLTFTDEEGFSIFTLTKVEKPYLDGLSLSTGTLTFDPETLEYTVDVPNETKSLTFTLTYPEGYSVKVNGQEVSGTFEAAGLVVGDENVYTIEVTGLGDKTTYTVTINRADAKDPGNPDDPNEPGADDPTKPGEDGLYLVKFDLAGGLGADGFMAEQKVEPKAKITMPLAPSRAGYIFRGWGLGGRTYLPGAKLMVTTNCTFVARWEKVFVPKPHAFAVSYKLNGGAAPEGFVERQVFETGTMITLPKAPTKAGFEFSGWTLNGRTFDAGAKVKVTSDAKFVATWKDANVKVYRLYNRWSGEHLYTKDPVERMSLIKGGWSSEGVAWVSPKSSDKPVYRLFNKNTGEHLYTKDANEKTVCVRNGWTDEGIAWYSDASSGEPVYRVYNRWNVGVAQHLYTTDLNEYETLVRDGWNAEGVAWHGVR